MRKAYPPNPDPEGPRSDAGLRQAWLDEIEDHPARWREEYAEAAACADLADELHVFRNRALHDPNLSSLLFEWDCYILEHDLAVVLEQCCDEGVLLPAEKRFARLRHCPQEQRQALRGLLVNCPQHIQYYLALHHYLIVRMGRAEETGKPDWRPETAPPRSVYRDNTFFRPQLLRVRNYAR